MNSLDGLRALAIISVILYHLDVPWLPSGHLGVVMFLVLTGYLITSSLLRSLQKNGPAAIPRFWGRRISRLWPPVAVMIAVVVLICIIFNHVLLTKAKPDVLPGLAFFENISYILRNVSYFEQIGGPSPLTHLWYLGIDVQFCLIWPLLMLVFAAVLPRSASRRITLVLAVASAVAMGLLWNPDSGVTRVYYGTDTRAFAPLVGAWLAYAIPVGRKPARDIRPFVESARLGIELAAIVSVALLVVGMVVLPDTSAILYRGGMFAAALLTAVIIATLALPGGLLSAILSAPPLAWLGSRSYGLYLWHFPLIQLLGAASNTAAWWKAPLVVVLSLLLAEISYRLIEQPVGSGTLLPGILDHLSQGPAAMASPLMIALAALLLVAVGDGVGMALIPDETLVPEDAIVSTGEAADKAMDLSQRKKDSKTDDKDSSTTKKKDDEEEVDLSFTNRAIPDTDTILHMSDAERSKGLYDPVLIGDSVPGDAQAFWDVACPDGLMDSYVGRRPDQAVEVLDDYLGQGVVGKIVILQAFSNVPCTDDQLDHMIQACGPDRIVYLVNVRIPESEQEQINQALARAATRYDNVHLIDWHALSEGQGEWIYPDGEHLTPTGQPIYIGMLVDAIAQDFADAGGTITRMNSAGSSTDASATETTATTDASAGTTTSADQTTTSSESTDQSQDSTDTPSAGEGTDAEVAQAAAPLRILMLGNSLTYYNDMPSMLAELTGADVEAHTAGSAKLSDQLDPDTTLGANTLEALAKQKWDYVVLQEKSSRPIRAHQDDYFESVKQLSDLAKKSGATPIIYATWPFSSDSRRLKKLGISRDEMAADLEAAFSQAADSSGALIADVEGAFQNAESVDTLYASDGVHPSAVGSRLAAEVIARTIKSDQYAQAREAAPTSKS